MPAQRTFDGETLEAALTRVTDEHGPAARILSAEKVRTGGVAGFFARERFEVLVELPEQADLGRPAEAVAAAPRSILELADQVSAAERHAGPRPGASAPSSAMHAPYAPSTEGRTFQDVLRGLIGDAGLTGPEVEPVAFESGGGSAGPAAEPVVEPVVWPATPPLAAPTLRAGAHARGSLPGTALMASLRALGVPQDLLGGVEGSGSEAQQVLATLEQMLVPPPPLIVDRGDVVVVVGERGVAIQGAGVAAAQLGQVQGDVVLAGAGRAGVNSLRGPEDAAARRPAWRSCSPTVVALCANDNVSGRMWVEEMIAALEPVAVWAAVRADRKPEDVATWAAAIGGVTALAVGACAETVSPASMLGAGLPIAAVEGRRSTPAAWTALLVERLAS